MLDATAITPWLGGVGAAIGTSVVVYAVLRAARSEKSVALLWWALVTFATGVMLYSMPSFMRSATGSLMPLRTIGIVLGITGSVAMVILARAHRKNA